MHPAIINDLGEMLYKAHVTRIPLMPYTSVYQDITCEEAYRIQRVMIEQYEKGGYTVSGKKLGYTNPSMQKELGLTEPSYGHLFREAYFLSGQRIPFDRFLQPGIEAEIAFVMKEDLNLLHVTETELLSAVGYVTAALEIVDTRQLRSNRTFVDSIGDNASFGACVLGRTRVPCSEIVFEKMSVTLMKNGEILDRGTGRSVMGSPINSMLWLANKLISQGSYLKRGDTVISGSLVSMAPAQKGDSFCARFDLLDEVRISFL